MLIMVIRKMLSNKWMVICLLAGAVLAVAMVSSIPIYTDGVLQRMLTKDLEEYQLSTRTFPEGIWLKQIFIPIMKQRTGSKHIIW